MAFRIGTIKLCCICTCAAIMGGSTTHLVEHSAKIINHSHTIQQHNNIKHPINVSIDCVKSEFNNVSYFEKLNIINSSDVSSTTPIPVPEPNLFFLFAIAVVTLFLIRRKNSINA